MNTGQKDADPRTGAEGLRPDADPEATAVLVDTPDLRRGGDVLQQALAAAEQQAVDNRENHLRALAEIENMRRRAVRDVENAHRYGLEKFAAELLAVRDSLELGLEAGEKADVRSLLAGKEATLKLLARAFEKFNITEINPVGEPFDPQFHEAMAMQESATAKPDTVLQVVQKGYLLNDRLLRPARVIVARAPGASRS
jgi:molecular chaperone GrpE